MVSRADWQLFVPREVADAGEITEWCSLQVGSWERRDTLDYTLYRLHCAEMRDKYYLLTQALPLVRRYGCACYVGVERADVSSDIKYVLCDLDGTILLGELLVLLAQGTAYEDIMAREVALAMSGQVDFATNFRHRTLLLQGQEVSRLRQICTSTGFALGFEDLISFWRTKSVRYELATGNYHIFAECVAERLGIDSYIATKVEVLEGRLTGRLVGTLVDALAKAGFLSERLTSLGLSAYEALAIGDGANDLAMLDRAGHSLLYSSIPEDGMPLSIYAVCRDIWGVSSDDIQRINV